jgi:hypothetical protein
LNQEEGTNIDKKIQTGMEVFSDKYIIEEFPSGEKHFEATHC